jgi:hypothetical protein
MRILAETVVGILFTLVLMWLLLGALNTIDSADPAGAFVGQSFAIMFGAFWIGLLLWVVLVVVGNIVHRKRRPGVRVLHNLLSALGSAVINILVFVVIGMSAGGWAALLIAIVVMAALAFLVAAAIAIPLTHLVFFRPRAAAPAPAAA